MLLPDKDQPILAWYPLCARGDFLANILFGNRILPDGCHRADHVYSPDVPTYHKMHDRDNFFSLSYRFQNGRFPGWNHGFFTIRVQILTDEDAHRVALLVMHKKNLPYDAAYIRRWEWENNDEDQRCEIKVPFADLWDENRVRALAKDARGRSLTEQEQERIHINMQLNREILDQQQRVFDQLPGWMISTHL